MPVADQLSRIDELLEARYRSADLGNLHDPLAEAVYILISQQTQEVVYKRVFASLRARYPRWRDLMAAPESEVEEVLGPAGLHRRKAGQLKSLLCQVADACRTYQPGRQRQDLNLDFLRGLPREEAEGFLKRLPGIGTKSARCVLSYSLGHEAFAVDTNVSRIFIRTGLVQTAGRKKDHDPFEAAVPPEMRKRLHMNLVHHGRAVCKGSGKPRCSDCILISFCQEGRRNPTARKASKDRKAAPAAIDLFGGAGGLGFGFRSAGFRVVAAVEADRNAAQTYRLNNPGTVVVEMEIGQSTTGMELQAVIPGAERVVALLAGPPCQGYSMAGARQADDPKNQMFQHVARIADELGVDVAVMENVPGMRNVGGRSFIDAVKGAFNAAGLECEDHLVRASDYGVPQGRRRILFLARVSGRPPIGEPAPTHLRHGAPRPDGDKRPATPTVLDALAPLPRLAAGQDLEWTVLADGTEMANLSTMDHSPEVRAKIRRITPGTGPISYRRLHPTEARTVIAGHRALPVHPVLHRTISVREAASIQGFPVDYAFCGLRSRQPLQVANAVPPPLARAVALHLIRYLRKEQGL